MPFHDEKCMPDFPFYDEKCMPDFPFYDGKCMPDFPFYDGKCKSEKIMLSFYFSRGPNGFWSVDGGV